MRTEVTVRRNAHITTRRVTAAGKQMSGLWWVSIPDEVVISFGFRSFRQLVLFFSTSTVTNDVAGTCGDEKVDKFDFFRILFINLFKTENAIICALCVTRDG